MDGHQLRGARIHRDMMLVSSVCRRALGCEWGGASFRTRLRSGKTRRAGAPEHRQRFLSVRPGGWSRTPVNRTRLWFIYKILTRYGPSFFCVSRVFCESSLLRINQRHHSLQTRLWHTPPAAARKPTEESTRGLLSICVFYSKLCSDDGSSPFRGAFIIASTPCSCVGIGDQHSGIVIGCSKSSRQCDLH